MPEFRGAPGIMAAARWHGGNSSRPPGIIPENTPRFSRGPWGPLRFSAGVQNSAPFCGRHVELVGDTSSARGGTPLAESRPVLHPRASEQFQVFRTYGGSKRAGVGRRGKQKCEPRTS